MGLVPKSSWVLRGYVEGEKGAKRAEWRVDVGEGRAEPLVTEQFGEAGRVRVSARVGVGVKARASEGRPFEDQGKG